MEPGSERNSRHEPTSDPRPTPEPERGERAGVEIISAARFIELVSAAFGDSRLFAVVERLRAQPPENEGEALEQSRHFFEAVIDRSDAAQVIGKLLYHGELPQFRFLAVRAKALEILLRPDNATNRAIHAALIDLNSSEDNFAAKCLIAESLNRLPIRSVEIGDEYLKFYGDRIAQAADKGSGNDEILALLKPSFEVSPSEKIAGKFCGDVITLVKLDVKLSSQVFDLLGRTGSELGLKTLEKVASGEAVTPPRFLDIATSNTGWRLIRTAITIGGIHVLGTLFGATSWTGEPNNWLIISAMSAAYHFLWKPFFEYQMENLRIAPNPHPINAVRAVLALGHRLPDPKIIDCLERILTQANLSEYARQEVTKVLSGAPASEKVT